MIFSLVFGGIRAPGLWEAILKEWGLWRAKAMVRVPASVHLCDIGEAWLHDPGHEGGLSSIGLWGAQGFWQVEFNFIQLNDFVLFPRHNSIFEG